MGEERSQKIPKNFAEFYQEMKALMDEFQKKTGENLQKFYVDLDLRIKNIESGTGKTSTPPPASLPLEKNLFDLRYSITGFVSWSNEERTEFERGLLDLMVKHRAYQLTATVSIKKI